MARAISPTRLSDTEWTLLALRQCALALPAESTTPSADSAFHTIGFRVSRNR